MGVEEIQAHPWFRGVDWDAVERMGYQPPFVPDPDKANFDATYDLEELLLEDNPLTYRPRKKKQPKKEEKAQSAPLSQIDPATRNSLGILSKMVGGAKEANSGQLDSDRKKKMSSKDRLQMELDYIDTHFKLFDSSIYDKYRGFADQRTMTVSEEVPSWVKNLDQEMTRGQGVQHEQPLAHSYPTSLLGTPDGSPQISRSPRGSAQVLPGYQPPAPPRSDRFSSQSYISRKPSRESPNTSPPYSPRVPRGTPPSNAIPTSSSRRPSPPSLPNPWVNDTGDLSDVGRRAGRTDVLDVVDSYAPIRPGLVPVMQEDPNLRIGTPPGDGSKGSKGSKGGSKIRSG